MAVELMMACSGDNLASKLQENALKEAATVGIQSVEEVIELLKQSHLQHQQRFFSSSAPPLPGTDNIVAVTDAAVSSFKKVISLLGRTSRTGHARFRRAPVTQPEHQIQLDYSTASVHPIKFPPPPPPPPTTETEQVSAFRAYQPTPPAHRILLPPLPNNHNQNQQQKAPQLITKNELAACSINFCNSPSISAATTTTFMSSLTGETDSIQRSVSSGFQFAHSSGKPPLSSNSLKRKCNSMDDVALKCGSSSGRCHCSKKRKSKVKRVIRVRAVSSKMADIPPDDYSWRKYGQKPIKGSPHPRGYYKCSIIRGCPARKHVERALDDPMMLIVTYEGEHNHPHATSDAPAVRVIEYS